MLAPSQLGLDALARHSTWVAGQLGVGREECVVLTTDAPLRELALDHVSGAQMWRARRQQWPQLLADVERIEFGEGVPLLQLQPVDTAQVTLRHWNGELRNAAFSIRFRSLACSLAVLSEEVLGRATAFPKRSRNSGLSSRARICPRRFVFCMAPSPRGASGCGSSAARITICPRTRRTRTPGTMSYSTRGGNRSCGKTSSIFSNGGNGSPRGEFRGGAGICSTVLPATGRPAPFEQWRRTRR